MDLLKTPQQKLMEDAGMTPASPGMLNTPKQLLMQEAGVMPHLAGGGQPNMSPQDMLAYLVASGHLPAHYAQGGSIPHYAGAGLVQNIGSQAAMTLPGMGEELKDIGRDIKKEKYGPAAVKAAAAGYSAFAPWNPLTAGISLAGYSPEVGDATLEGNRRFEEEKELKRLYDEFMKNSRLQNHGRAPLSMMAAPQDRTPGPVPEVLPFPYEKEPTLGRQSLLTKKTSKL